MSTHEPLLISTLGCLKIYGPDGEIPTTPSRKTRALLGYLLISGQPQRRERLCDMFWDGPDDPRGALRWSLSKLRGILNRVGRVCVMADRDRVWIDMVDVEVDIHEILRLVDDPDASAEALARGWRTCQQPLLDDCELPNLRSFTAWLQRERVDIARVRRKLAARLAGMKGFVMEEAIKWADAWAEDAPLDPTASAHAVAIRIKFGFIDDAKLLYAACQQRFRAAGQRPPDWPEESSSPVNAGDAPSLPKEAVWQAPEVLQRIRFIKATDGTNLAWATAGDEALPPLVKAANWLSHLELDWDAPIWCPLFRDLARDRCFIRYDGRGCGLSDWNVPEINFDTFVTDLETVVDAAGLERFPLLGISQGAAVSIEYAARHPERVSHLILFGGFAAGWRHVATPQERLEREAVMVLTEAGWGRDDPMYRQMLSRTCLQQCTEEELDWFAEFQRHTATASNAIRFIDACSRLDVRQRLAQLRVPTLVIHSRGDRRIPVSCGRALAAAIPGAELIMLDTPNHVLLGREPAGAAFLAAVREFLARKTLGRSSRDDAAQSFAARQPAGSFVQVTGHPKNGAGPGSYETK